jgi:predicted Zn-dependent protease with MMP-like domain
MDDERHPLDPEAERELESAWDHLDDGDIDEAARAIESARASAGDDPAVLELEAELALARDDPEAALAAYVRWSEADPDDPTPWLDSAEVYLDYGDDPREPARLLRELLAGPPLDPLDEADAHHLLGLAFEQKGDRKGMVREWLAVLRLDAITDEDEPLMSPDEFERAAAAALDELPEEIIAHLRNVPILVEDRPSESLVLEGLDPRTLGLFHGIAMPDQSVLGPGPSGGLIHLFQRNLEREAEDQDDLAEQIRITVAHETAHYFGADEDQLGRFGLN